VISGAGWMTRKTAAAYADTSIRTIDRAFASGQLQSIGQGRLRRTRPEWVDEWIQRQANTNHDMPDE